MSRSRRSSIPASFLLAAVVDCAQFRDQIAPDRMQKLVLLSPGGGFVPMVRQFSLRGMLSQRRIVDARVLDFLEKTRTDDRGPITERSVA